MKVISLAFRDIQENKKEFFQGLLILFLIIFLSSLTISLERGSAERVKNFYVKSGASSLLVDSEEVLPYFEDLEEKVVYYSALDNGSKSDVYKLVNQRGDTREFLGVRVNLLAVPDNFVLKSDYYVKTESMKNSITEGLPFTNRSRLRKLSEAQEWLNIKSNQDYIRIPLLPKRGDTEPDQGEILVDENVMNYLGLEIGDIVRLDLRSERRHYIGEFEVTGSFKTVGTQGSDRSFWRVYHENSFFDARPPQAELSGIAPVIVNYEELNRTPGMKVLRANSLESKGRIFQQLEERNYNVYEPEEGGHIKIEKRVSRARSELGIFSISLVLLEVLCAFSVGYIWSFNRREDRRIYRWLGFNRFQAAMYVLITIILMCLAVLPLALFSLLGMGAILVKTSISTFMINYLIAGSVSSFAGLYESRIKI